MSLLTESAGGVATLTLARPEIHNAFDDHLILALTSAIETAIADPAVRVIMLAAQGTSFSAGGDLNWMKRMAGYSHAENLADAQALARLMQVLDTSPKPTIARVQGQAFAGGTGLIACCDIAIAAEPAVFAITETKIGLIPAVISPYLVRAMGARQARRWFLTGARFTAQEALSLGLVHAVVPPEQLDAAIQAELKALLANSPAAMRAAKELVVAVDQPLTQAVIDDTARRIADLRAAPDGREGVSSFLEKRRPVWPSAKESVA